MPAPAAHASSNCCRLSGGIAAWNLSIICMMICCCHGPMIGCNSDADDAGEHAADRAGDEPCTMTSDVSTGVACRPCSR